MLNFCFTSNFLNIKLFMSSHKVEKIERTDGGAASEEQTRYDMTGTIERQDGLSLEIS